jgi:hypothetical protein
MGNQQDFLGPWPRKSTESQIGYKKKKLYQITIKRKGTVLRILLLLKLKQHEPNLPPYVKLKTKTKT